MAVKKTKKKNVDNYLFQDFLTKVIAESKSNQWNQGSYGNQMNVIQGQRHRKQTYGDHK